MTKYSWNSTQCEACWITRHLTRDENDQISVRRPVRLADPKLDQCCFCGVATISGIMVRTDPATVAFPRLEEDE